MMIGFQEKNGTLFADELNLADIAANFGTPVYVYSAPYIRQQYDKLSGAMRKALPADRQPLLCYACKANSNIAVLKILKDAGSGLEIVSQGELVRGLRAGFDPAKIVSTGVGKSASEIAAALKVGIHQFNVESLPELFQINRIAKELGAIATIVFRLNPDVAGGGHSKISTGRKHDKFGITANDVEKGFEITKTLSNVKAVGLSMHIGSQVFTVESFKNAFDKLPDLVKKLRSSSYTISRLDIGGGFPIQYNEENLLDLDAYASWVRDIILPLDVDIIMEPGRFLVGNAGVLLAKIILVKENGERSFIVLDAAMNDLIRPAMYDAWHNIEPVCNRSRQSKTYDIVGPICESSDFFAKDRAMPAVQENELLVIRTAGAYGASMASNYNTRPLIAEVLVDGKKIDLIRKAQTYDDIIALESIPPWLK